VTNMYLGGIKNSFLSERQNYFSTLILDKVLNIH